MKLVRLLDVAKLSSERVTHFTGARPYVATGDLSDDGELSPQMVTFEDRPSRADLTVSAGDVCFARMAATKKVMQFDERHSNLILSTGFAILRPEHKRLDPSYLRNWLNLPTTQSRKDELCSGATQKAITNEKISDFIIPIPETLEEQRRIAAILDKANALRTKRREAIAKLDQLLQSVFLDMFGDTAIETNELCRKIESVLEKIIDYRGKTPEKTERGVPLITAKLVKEMRIAQPTEFIAEESFVPWMTRGIPKPGSVLITTEAPMGQVAQVPEYRAALAQRLLALEVKEQQVDPTFLMWALSMPSTQDQLRKYSTGSTVTGIRQKEFRRVLIPVPEMQEQRQFADIARSIQREKVRYESTLDKSNALFMALQNAAFSGSLAA
jgi:type I restriction enzyme S subunit